MIEPDGVGQRSLERLVVALDGTAFGIAVVDAGRTVTFANGAFARSFGLPGPGDLVGRSWSTLYDAEELARIERALRSTASATGAWTGVAVGFRNGDGRFTHELTIFAAGDAGLLCLVRDASADADTVEIETPVSARRATAGDHAAERRRAEEALRRSEERYRALFEQSRDAIYISSRDGQILDANGSALELFGYDRQEMIGLDARLLYADEVDRERFQAEVEHVDSVRDFEVKLRRKDGTLIDCLLASTVRRDADGAILGYHGIIHDITERKNAEARLLHDAFHDALTGLANRALFRDRLERLIERARRRKRDLFAVLFLDVDRFKVVNDSLGHLVGDQLLIAIARRLEQCLRPADTVARLGGDEFAILLDDIRDTSDATRVAERVLKALELPFYPNGHEVFTGASIGIAVSATGYDRPDDLLRDADIAMYRAKALGRGRHLVFDTAMHAQAVALLELETDLRRAAERHEFSLVYQPIVSLADGRVTGFEALLRWGHPEKGTLPPAEFIPHAEETGLIVPIGLWVLQEACRQLRVWRDAHPDHDALTMHVNLSGKQFSQPGLVEQIAAILEETAIDGRSLVLEITESVIMGDAASAVAMLEKLKAMGVQLCIDDFGTGYSSLSYLHRFPTDSLKIDRSFVGRIGVDGENLEVVRTIVALARNLGMAAIPEGVETREHLVQLLNLGCDHGQGFLFSRPLERGAAGELLARRPPSVDGF